MTEAALARNDDDRDPTVRVHMRLGVELLARIDVTAGHERRTRSNLVQVIVASALRREFVLDAGLSALNYLDASGPTAQVTLHLPGSVLDELDDHACEFGVSRTVAIVAAVVNAFARAERGWDY